MRRRDQSLQLARYKQFDLVVIGGGITGAGVAQDAASRGLSVALIERDDFSSGTSSRTSKLIHGGLRYLEQFHFALTAQLCAERAKLERLAPHLVHPFSFVLPLLRRREWFGFKACVGLAIYDLLSWSYSHRPCKRLSRAQALELCPQLNAEQLSGGLQFYDSITDDSRIVLEVIKSACREGAVALNYVEAASFRTAEGRIYGVNCRDRVTGETFALSCKICVNAAGVWSDELCKQLDNAWVSKLAPSKGVHIVVPPSSLETSSALFLPTSDRRYLFVLPWQRALLIGTTDAFYTGDINRPLALSAEVDYLLAEVNNYLQENKLSRRDVIASFAGLRPLLREGDIDSSQITRKGLVFSGPCGMLGIIGGKLTNYRVMAQLAVDRAVGGLKDTQAKNSRTARMMLGGWAGESDYLSGVAAISARARRLSLEPATLDHLITTYGADADKILDTVEKQPQMAEHICVDFPPVLAEIPFCAEQEMVVCLEDLLMRRTRLGYLNQRQCLESAPRAAKILGEVLGWNKARTAVELQSFEKTLEEQLDLLAQPIA